MTGWLHKRFTAKLMLLIGLVLVMPAITYLVAVLIASSTVKQEYIRTIDEYAQSERQLEGLAAVQAVRRRIKRVSLDAARELELFLDAHAGMGAAALAREPAFRSIATQPAGRRASAFVVDATTGRILVHPDRALEGEALSALGDGANLVPIADHIREGKFSQGEIDWSAPNGAVVHRVLFATPVPIPAADGHRLAAVATADIDERLSPQVSSHSDAVKRILTNIEQRRTTDLLLASLLASAAMGAILIILSLWLLRKGVASLHQLQVAASAVAVGHFDLSVKPVSDDEFGQVAEAFNKMATVLKETVVSRNFYEEAKIEAEQANRLKSEFLTNISHEIRTPLNGIIGFAEILQDEEQKEENRRYLGHILQCGRSLLALINDILDLSKIEAGKISLKIEAVDPRELVGTVRDLFDLAARQKGVRLMAEIDPEVPATVETDGLRLRQILVNLVDNAVKFTDQGTVTIRVRRNRSLRRGWVHFSVEDTGIGIPPDKHDLVFASFTQVDPHSAKARSGTGLGLAISSNLANLLGGEMWLESEPGKGSTFSFTIA